MTTTNNTTNTQTAAERHPEAFEAYFASFCAEFKIRKPRAPKSSFHLVECDGEAHKSGGMYHDHCSVCMPRWGKVLVSSDCPDVQSWRAKLDKLSEAEQDALWTTRKKFDKAQDRQNEYAWHRRSCAAGFEHRIREGRLSPEIAALLRR